jgi:predicted regulator of Ras-like GTPase activity (Roadblock/LC7/MglB family)
MDSILRDINAIDGVTGSFVCTVDGALLADAAPATLREGAARETAASSVAQILSGLKNVWKSDVRDVDLHCDRGRLVVKAFGTGCLCIVCTPHVSLPHLNLTANVAARKLGRMIKKLAGERRTPEQHRAEQGAGREPAGGQSTDTILEKVLDLWR